MFKKQRFCVARISLHKYRVFAQPDVKEWKQINNDGSCIIILCEDIMVRDWGKF